MLALRRRCDNLALPGNRLPEALWLLPKVRQFVRLMYVAGSCLGVFFASY